MDTSAPSTTQNPDAIRRAWAAGHVAPLWENRAAHGNRPGAEPAHIWRWADMQPLIEAAIGVRSMEAVERRVLSLVSPHAAAVAGAAGTTTNLNAGLQILMPGEVARPHRHSMNALRFVLAGDGATTVVDGKRCPMSVGDLVTTPGWCWHEHVHRGEQPIIWLDVLDASLHRYLGTDAFQPGPANLVRDLTPDAAFTSACLVPEIGNKPTEYSPVFRYPWSQSAAALAAAPLSADGSRRVRYVNPLDGGPVMSLLDCWLVEIPAGAQTTALRTSANAVCSIVEGEGSSEIGTTCLDWGPRDVISLPHGNWMRHRAGPGAGSGPARLFFVSDRPVLARLGLLKEEFAGAA